MARRQVVEITCDRCGKTETQSPSEIWGEGTLLELKFKDQAVVYEDMCRTCMRTVTNLMARVAKEEKAEPAVTKVHEDDR